MVVDGLFIDMTSFDCNGTCLGMSHSVLDGCINTAGALRRMTLIVNVGILCLLD